MPAALPVAPSIPPAPLSSAPLYQNQIEVIPSPPAPSFESYAPNLTEAGRNVEKAIQADEELSKAVRLTIKVSSAENRVTLKGLVLDEKTKARVGKKAQEIAGKVSEVENQLIALNQ